MTPDPSAGGGANPLSSTRAGRGEGAAEGPTTPLSVRQDAAALAGCALLVPFVWLLLGWRPDRLVSGYDALTALTPMLQALVEAGGNPSALAYRPELLGGVALRDTLGPQPLLVLLAAAGLGAPAILNLTTFVVQILLAFFGQRVIHDLGRLLGAPPWPTPVRISLAVVFVAFAPFLGWRLGYGHQSLLVGLLPFLALLSLVATTLVGSASRALVAVAVLTIATSLPLVGQQTVLYGALFGLPVLWGLWRSGGGPPRAFVTPALVGLAGLLLAAPAYAPMIAHALSRDALRELGGPVNTYSYLTAGPGDWLTSLPWGAFLLPGRPEIQHHESNLPLGPLVLFLTLVPRRGRPLLVGLAVSAGLAVLFASNARPVSDLLLWLAPPLRSFRAPTRALLPALLVLPMVALSVLPLARRRFAPAPPGPVPPAGPPPSGTRYRIPWAEVALALVSFAGLFVAPAAAREIVAWLVAAALLVGPARTFRRTPAQVAIAAVLAGASLGAFRERLLPFPDASALLAQARLMGERAVAMEPALAEPLTRLTLDTDHHPLGANAAFAAGLSSLDGYAFPQRRFVALVRGLRGEPYSQNALLLRFHEEKAPSRVLFQLYNVGYRLDGAPDPSGPRVQRRGPTAGAAWFPATLSEAPSWEGLSAGLSTWGDEAHELARRELRILSDDLQASGLRAPLAPECALAEVERVDRASGAFLVSLRTAARCPLVLALNYGGILKARGRGGDGSWRPLPIFAAYGALLGVAVEPGTELVEVTTRPWPPPWTLVAAAAGALVALAAILRSER